MKLVIFSDIHGNSYALDKFIEKTQNITYDYLVFCGDIFGYYYNQKEVIEKLSVMDKLIWLRGNHDQYFLDIYKERVSDAYYIQQYGHSYYNLKQKYSQEEAAIIESHKMQYILEDKYCKIGIFHGTPENSFEGRLYPDNNILNCEEYQKYDIVILGHTHFQMMRKVGHTLVLNPGSLGQPRDGKGYSFAILDTLRQNVEFKEIEFNQVLLYQQIEEFDNELKKLKSVLERRHGFEKNTNYRN